MKDEGEANTRNRLSATTSARLRRCRSATQLLTVFTISRVFSRPLFGFSPSAALGFGVSLTLRFTILTDLIANTPQIPFNYLFIASLNRVRVSEH